jgi:murein L,D-transpeptidase YcbB/YkuD
MGLILRKYCVAMPSRIALGAVCAMIAFSVHAQPDQQLSGRLDAELAVTNLDVMGERLYTRDILRTVYRSRSFQPIWMTEHGVSEEAAQFIDWLRTVPSAHGLRPEDYHLDALVVMQNEPTRDLAELELMLSDAFLICASHLLEGRINPETLESEWAANRRHDDLVPLLERVGGDRSAGALLEQLLPQHADYRALVAYLAELRALHREGGWPIVDQGPTLRRADAGRRVVQLTERLRLSGDLRAPISDLFTVEVAAAVQRFQARHGLNEDGLVGRATLAALNRSVESRIDQIIVNLERWRWLPETLGDRYVLVNVAAFRLDAVERGISALHMKVVVGLPYRRTPVFSDTIRFLVLNPNWEVPPRIAVEDKLPLIKANPRYLLEEGYQLLLGSGADERVVDPLTVDWTKITRRNFPFRLRQLPGPFNPLGRVKFMFPNKFSVYLHDTPSRGLFAEDARAFSSGCIRLEAPFDLAELLLRDDPDWPRARIELAAAEDMQQTVWLPRPMPIHLLYWTAWIDPSNGSLHFSDDVYGRDAGLLRELREPPPDRVSPSDRLLTP